MPQEDPGAAGAATPQRHLPETINYIPLQTASTRVLHIYTIYIYTHANIHIHGGALAYTRRRFDLCSYDRDIHACVCSVGYYIDIHAADSRARVLCINARFEARVGRRRTRGIFQVDYVAEVYYKQSVAFEAKGSACAYYNGSAG